MLEYWNNGLLDHKWRNSLNPLVRHEVTQEMRVGPSEPAYRSWLQTALSCSGQESG